MGFDDGLRAGVLFGLVFGQFELFKDLDQGDLTLFLFDFGVRFGFFVVVVEAFFKELSELEIAREVFAHAFRRVVDMLSGLGLFVVEFEANRDFLDSFEVNLGHLG